MPRLESNTLQILLLAGLAYVAGCGPVADHSSKPPASTASPAIDSLPPQHHPPKYKPALLSITGEFDGKPGRDTLVEHLYSRTQKMEIDSVPHPDSIGWDASMMWHEERETEVFLSLAGKNADTLWLGKAYGLFCLINLGDNNRVGRDELALSVDRIDFSMVNSCSIYSLCKGEWQSLMRFEIHESPFFYGEGDTTNPLEIEGFLERRGKKWVFADYGKDPGMLEFEPLVLDQCK